jgi:hypothetical protein
LVKVGKEEGNRRMVSMNRKEILDELELTLNTIDTINKIKVRYDDKSLELIRMLKYAK